MALANIARGPLFQKRSSFDYEAFTWIHRSSHGSLSDSESLSCSSSESIFIVIFSILRIPGIVYAFFALCSFQIPGKIQLQTPLQGSQHPLLWFLFVPFLNVSNNIASRARPVSTKRLLRMLAKMCHALMRTRRWFYSKWARSA